MVASPYPRVSSAPPIKLRGVHKRRVTALVVRVTIPLDYAQSDEILVLQFAFSEADDNVSPCDGTEESEVRDRRVAPQADKAIRHH